ncbi:MAG: hypothetical protein KDC85_17350 [Saprospiraceae bacterium]|nr:hypothetical protein [Saprospiraceae bacterium]MCB9326989.1 hypothetical protein [Lewinellaceae bacterium]
MKKLLLPAIFMLLMFANCHQEATSPTNNMVHGTITGPNPMACPTICCSGWFIEIDGQNYHFLDFPEGSEFNADDITDYPFEVLLDYELSDDCWENTIVLLEIEAA